jgi:hypothetical protein
MPYSHPIILFQIWDMALFNEKERGSFEKSNPHLFFLKPFSKEEGVPKSSFGSFNT